MPDGADDITFATLAVEGWRQFGDIRIDFHPNLTVLTGANAAGKTTLLNLLGRHFNWVVQFMGVPVRDNVGRYSWATDDRHLDAGSVPIGQMTYSNGTECQIYAQTGSVLYDVILSNQLQVAGLFIPSHRTLSRYVPLESIPTHASVADVLLTEYGGEILSRFQGGYSPKTPMVRMKEALVAAAIFGYGNQAVEANPGALEIWLGFQEVLINVLPTSFGLTKMSVRGSDILMHTSSGDFLLDSVSGGIGSLIELSWQIFLRSLTHAIFTVCIDEPENHLHPSMQRSLLPSLISAFPNIRFIVATHSPFIVTSVDDSNVYALDYSGEGFVHSRLLESVNKSASSDEILRRVLGLETTVPLWVERQLDEILTEFGPESMNAKDLRRLKDRLETIGLASEFPAAIDAISSRSVGHEEA